MKNTNNYSFGELNNGCINTETCGNVEIEIGTLEITGTGIIRVRNTGGSSASEGGMGTGTDDDKEKGELNKKGVEPGKSLDDSEDFTLDPIKKNVRENEKSSS